LKAKADGIVLSANLGRQTQQLRQLVQSSEKWIANAELHARRIPGVKDYYRNVESDMKALVDREHRTGNSVARSRISVGVGQKDIDASQADIQVGQTWDLSIVDSGRSLSKTFATLPQKCSAKGLEKRGAGEQALTGWQRACDQALTERAKFEPVFKRITDQRAELKSFQSAAESRRRALVAESDRIQ
jgi:hypothetical protein